MEPHLKSKLFYTQILILANIVDGNNDFFLVFERTKKKIITQYTKRLCLSICQSLRYDNVVVVYRFRAVYLRIINPTGGTGVQVKFHGYTKCKGRLCDISTFYLNGCEQVGV